MKRKLILLAAVFILCSPASAQKYIDAENLTLINKLCDTEHRYRRVDTDKYPDLTKKEASLLQQSAGHIIAFRTDSKNITVKTEYHHYGTSSTMSRTATAGYDLYIRKDGKWIWAACGSADKGKAYKIAYDMDSQPKECLLYMPLFSIVDKVEIGVDDEASIEPLDNPFRHRIILLGSSFMHGSGTNRSGMAVPMQLERATGMQFISLGMSGNCKLQPAIAQIIADNQCDALIVDGFSNSTADIIRERLIPFISKIREAHPDIPIIFLRSIHRERSNFNLEFLKMENSKHEAGDEMIAKAMKMFDNIYYIDKADQTGTDHETSVDGTHPGDMGYMRWARTIQPGIVRILKKHGIK